MTGSHLATADQATDESPRSLATPAETAELLVQAEKHGMELTVRIMRLEEELAAAEAPITEGDDPRLVQFWEKAGNIADRLDLCPDYDRVAEAMNGVRRIRDWDVTGYYEVTVRISRTIEARTADDAETELSESIDRSDIEEEIRRGEIVEWSLTSTEAELE